MRRSWRDETGQTMIIVALAAVVLLGALALAVDWGYGLTQRRVMQASSDAAALAVGRYLATSVIEVDGTTMFSVTEADAWCVAQHFVVEKNDSFRPAGEIPTFTLQVWSGAVEAPWRDIPAPAGGCPAGPSVAVRPDTLYVRVGTTLTYRSLVAGIIGFPRTTAAASARVKLSGTAVPTTGPVWPMVRHYDPADFDMPCPPASCDPTDIDPLTFWSPNEDDMVYGQFKGLIDFSRDSSRLEPLVPQLLTEWDQSGSALADPATPLKIDRSGNCGGLWDTMGGEKPSLHGKQCSIPNWFYYAFQGSPSLTAGWIADTPTSQEAPDVLTSRGVCDPSQAPDPAPSCEDNTIGDWIETAFGDIGTNMSSNMKQMIQSHGFIGPYSDKLIENGPNKGEPYGKALVVLVYLWDCAETFNSSAPVGQQWDLILPGKGPGGDCAKVPRTGSAPTPDRVHLFTAAPFTFYEGLVSSQAIQGYWGGAFGDSRECQDCPLNPLANTAFLIADDDYSGP